MGEKNGDCRRITGVFLMNTFEFSCNSSYFLSFSAKLCTKVSLVHKIKQVFARSGGHVGLFNYWLMCLGVFKQAVWSILEKLKK